MKPAATILREDTNLFGEDIKLVILIRGKPVSGNHKTGQRAFEKQVYDHATGQVRRKLGVMNYTTKVAREYTERVRSIALYAAAKCNWVRPGYARCDVVLYNINMDRGNVDKVVEDALQGIAFDNDSHVLDGGIQKRKDDLGVRVEIIVRPVNGRNYGYK